MATVSGAIQKLIVQDLAPGVRDAMVEIAPWFENVAEESFNVTQSNIGQDWKVIHTFITSLAGALKAAGTVAGDPVYSTSTPYTVHGEPGTFPGIVGSVSPGYAQSELTLQEWQGNMHIPQEFLRADQLTASISSAVAAVVKQPARKVALAKAGLWLSNYDSTASTKILGAVSSVTSGGDVTDATVQLVADDVSTVRKLMAGLEVDVYDSTGATKRNGNSKCLVYFVNPLNNTIRIDSADGAALFSTQIVATDIIVLADSKGNGPTGLDQWFPISGTIYNLALATLPQLASIRNAVSGSLTDTVLRKFFAGRLVGWGEAGMPDTILSTPGVLSEYVNQFDGSGFQRFQSQGQAQSIRGGYQSGTSITIDGREITIQTSSMCPQGYLYAFKMKNGNIKRYVPPRLPGTNSAGGAFNRDIEFFAPLGGSKDIWKHAHYNSNTTKYLEAPFISVEEYIPEMIGGIRLTGITEERAVS
jgi:hypothetical protein